MTAEERFKAAVIELVQAGRYPAATALNTALERHRERADLSGREERWRREALLELGWIRRANGSRSWGSGAPEYQGRPQSRSLRPPGRQNGPLGAILSS